MSTYYLHGEELGAFLPGLMKIVKAPFKAAGSIAKGFAHNPLEGIKATIKAPFQTLGAVKFAVLGSSKKPAPSAAQTQKNEAQGIPTVDTTSQETPPHSPYVQPLVFPTNGMIGPVPSADQTPIAPGSEIPTPFSAPSSKAPIMLIAGLGVAAVGAYFLLKKKRR